MYLQLTISTENPSIMDRLGSGDINSTSDDILLIKQVGFVEPL